ncbi:MAG: A24 family peptidase C-terminal domain-containing protein [Candidatus Bathyarchaeia archaeon]
MVNALLDLLRLGLCLSFLTVASIYDLKFREVPNTVWIISAPIGLTLSAISLALNISSRPLDALIWTVTLIIVSGLSLALFYLGLWGGADAKALICLAASMPTRLNIEAIRPMLEQCLQNSFSLPISISTLNNSVLAAALLTATIALRNLIDLARSGGKIFEGLEGEGLIKKTLAFMTGYRVDAEKLRSKRHHYIIIEEFSVGSNGSFKRRLKGLRLLGAENDVEGKVPEDICGKIWVTPALPFLLFMEAGLIMTVFLGDVIFCSTFIFMKSMSTA